MNNNNLATGSLTLKYVATQINGSEDATQEELESLTKKGLMSVIIIEDDADLAESLIVYGIDQELVYAFQNGNLSITNLSKSIN